MKMTVRLLFIILLLGKNTCLVAQSNLRKVSILDLPQNIQDIPNISGAYRWTDSLGDNVIVITKKVVKRYDEDRVTQRGKHSRAEGHTDNFPKQTIPSFTSHFKIIKDSAVATWKVAGISKLCEGEDINHVKSWFVITDLNEDHLAEVWLISRGECLNDVNIGNMKIVMYENYKGYSMNGNIGGENPPVSYLDNNFINGPEIFKNYVLKLWQKFK